MINPTALSKVNGVGKICWAGRDFNCIEEICGFVMGQGRWAEGLSAPSHCWGLGWNLTLSNRQKNQLFQATERVVSCLCSFHTNVWGPAKFIYLNVGLKNWSFQNCLTVLSLLMPWTSILNWGLDDIFMVVLKKKKKKLGRFQYHFSNVCFLQNDTKRCFLSICRGTAHSYLYEKIMVTKILFFFYWMLTL